MPARRPLQPTALIPQSMCAHILPQRNGPHNQTQHHIKELARATWPWVFDIDNDRRLTFEYVSAQRVIQAVCKFNLVGQLKM